MKSLIVLSRLMAYPTAEMQQAVPEMRAALQACDELSRGTRDELEQFLQRVAETPLLELQEEYVNIFDRGRHHSLHLFEHVHGESRDRGQAMVELINYYREGGLELDARELPDYLPLMLEFLATRPREEILEMLADAMAVIVLLGARLREKELPHAVLFDALVELGGEPEEAREMREQAATEGEDESITKMDEIWEEEQVTFLGNTDPAQGGGCPAATGTPAGSSPGQEIPLQWMDKPGATGPDGQAPRR